MVMTNCDIRDHFDVHGWAVHRDFLQLHELEELRRVGPGIAPRSGVLAPLRFFEQRLLRCITYRSLCVRRNVTLWWSTHGRTHSKSVRTVTGLQNSGSKLCWLNQRHIPLTPIARTTPAQAFFKGAASLSSRRCQIDVDVALL